MFTVKLQLSVKKGRGGTNKNALAAVAQLLQGLSDGEEVERFDPIRVVFLALIVPLLRTVCIFFVTV